MKEEVRKWKEFSSQVQISTEKELKEKDTLVYKLHFEKLSLKDNLKLFRIN